MNRPLLDYLTRIRELEEMKYTTDCLARRLVQQGARLGKSRNIPIPHKVTEDNGKSKGMMIGGILGAITGGIYCILNLINTDGIFRTLWEIVKGTFVAFLFACLGLLLGVAIGRIKDKRIEKQRNIQNQVEALAQLTKDEARVKKELEIRNQLIDQSKRLVAQMRKMEDVLDKLYAIGVVHPKYHGLVPISMFCEYLETGMCTELEGHEGAYLIYEQQIRLDKILCKLDDINKNLNAIKQNQYLLYQSISEGNQLIEKVVTQNNDMIHRLGRLEQNSELIEFNTRANYLATQALGDMMVFQALVNN